MMNNKQLKQLIDELIVNFDLSNGITSKEAIEYIVRELQYDLKFKNRKGDR